MILCPLISLSTRLSGPKSMGTKICKFLLNSGSISETKHHLNIEYAKKIVSIIIPVSRPSKFGCVATLRPGCGIKKHAISEKHDFICFLRDCSSECCRSDTCNRRSKIFLPPSTPYSASYGKLQSLTRNWSLWNGVFPESAKAKRPYSVKS